MTDKVKPLSDDALREIEVLLVRYDGIDRKLCGKDTAEGVTERLRHNEIKAEIATVENVRSLYATVRVLRETLLALNNCQNKPVCGHCAALLRAVTKEQP